MKMERVRRIPVSLRANRLPTTGDGARQNGTKQGVLGSWVVCRRSSREVPSSSLLPRKPFGLATFRYFHPLSGFIIADEWGNCT